MIRPSLVGLESVSAPERCASAGVRWLRSGWSGLGEGRTWSKNLYEDSNGWCVGKRILGTNIKLAMTDALIWPGSKPAQQNMKKWAMCDAYSQVSAHKGDRDQRKDDKDQFQIWTWTGNSNLKSQCELQARISLQRSTHFYKHEARKGDWDQRADNKDQSQTSYKDQSQTSMNNHSQFLLLAGIAFAMKLYQIIIAFTPQHISNNYQQI